MEDKDRKCRFCEKVWSTFEHMLRECEVIREWGLDLPGLDDSASRDVEIRVSE